MIWIPVHALTSSHELTPKKLDLSNPSCPYTNMSANTVSHGRSNWGTRRTMRISIDKIEVSLSSPDTKSAKFERARDKNPHWIVIASTSRRKWTWSLGGDNALTLNLFNDSVFRQQQEIRQIIADIGSLNSSRDIIPDGKDPSLRGNECHGISYLDL